MTKDLEYLHRVTIGYCCERFKHMVESECSVKLNYLPGQGWYFCTTVEGWSKQLIFWYCPHCGEQLLRKYDEGRTTTSSSSEMNINAR